MSHLPLVHGNKSSKLITKNLSQKSYQLPIIVTQQTNEAKILIFDEQIDMHFDDTPDQHTGRCQSAQVQKRKKKYKAPKIQKIDKLQQFKKEFEAEKYDNFIYFNDTRHQHVERVLVKQGWRMDIESIEFCETV
ncbi:Hypothetical_protein [Hexamita inflata]|uniref:Hypothetical_protein n=1 Tax=Hexamita inflata TaxID=28002 RepID=A0AA86UPB6_9EUKA|nr:Hypothetical protein HINF_LOCUS39447 [Hexamita inflata]CAI9959442.1 Hypothetical protein HINF_LOCUS47087 [Hexamita inflata]